MNGKSRVAVFIDGSNLYFAVRDGLNIQKPIDIQKFSHKLVEDRELVRIYYYNAPPPPEDDPEVRTQQQRFRDKLGYIDFLQKRDGRLEGPHPFQNTSIFTSDHLHLGLPVSAGGTAPFSPGIMFGFPTKGNL